MSDTGITKAETEAETSADPRRRQALVDEINRDLPLHPAPPMSAKARGKRPAQDLEQGGIELPTNLTAWLQAVAFVDPQLLIRYARDPDAMIEAAKAAARNTIVPPEKPTGLNRLWKGTTMYTDLISSSDFRDQLRRLEFDASGDADASDPRSVLGTMRDVFAQMRAMVADLGDDTDPDLVFAKQQVTGQLDQLISDLGAIAFDRTFRERVGVIAGTAASFALIPLPFVYSNETRPASWLYTGALGGAYARTVTQMGGLLVNPGLNARLWMNNFRDRHLIWFLPAVFFAIQAFIKAYADEHPENTAIQGPAEAAIEVNESKWFPAIVATAEFGLFMASNFPDQYQQMKDWAWRKTAGEKGRNDPETLGFVRRWLANDAIRMANLNSGGVTVPADDNDTAGLIRDHYKFASGLWSVVRTARERYEEGGRIGDAESQLLDQVGSGLQKIGELLDPLIKNVMAQVELITAEEKRAKKIAAPGLLGAAALIGTVNSLGAIRIPALLADYIPYYVTAWLVELARLRDDSKTVESAIRTFGSYLGGSLVGTLPSIINLAFEFAFHEGAFDLVTTERPEGLPANATFTHTTPSMLITEHPDLHIADGKVNFALYTAYQMLTYLLISGRMGEAVSASTLWLMRGITRKNAAIALPEDTGSGGFEVPEGFDERYMDRLESALAKFKARFDAEVTRLEGETARIEDVTDDDLPEDMAALPGEESLGMTRMPPRRKGESSTSAAPLEFEEAPPKPEDTVLMSEEAPPKPEEDPPAEPKRPAAAATSSQKSAEEEPALEGWQRDAAAAVNWADKKEQ
ncbi:hypothetical protein FFK22_002510 [Mycobacterium sp. KBS0706]|uniref:hypothetical protein n=1 Tax=Mycobacterium sp. KBS0706 TaxID=2578109 RepID=UPI00110FA30D|nr:hypothetical protein [Mycobacterium sp. KBS0706]TSD90343.1 hypothetical protein FFK22_002510 [Mycobacterium sp. KBS0706]